VAATDNCRTTAANGAEKQPKKGKQTQIAGNATAAEEETGNHVHAPTNWI